MSYPNFLSKFTQGDPAECWEWQGYIHPQTGYGKLGSRRGGENKCEQAHRVSFRYFCGPIPDGMLVCHICDNRKCVNPAHLFLGTHQDNMDDMMRKGRHAPGSRDPQNGEANRNARLDSGQVAEIRALGAAGYHHSTIAAQFGISRAHVWRIIKRIRWA